MRNLLNQGLKLCVFDSNILMTAYHEYYAPDICPGFWDCLNHFCLMRQVGSIDKVKDEIRNPPELVRWAYDLPDDTFASTEDKLVLEEFSEMINWVEEQDQFFSDAKQEFRIVADGRLAAYAKVHGATVVTHEKFDPRVRKKVPLPNVCFEFGVEYMTIYDMLRELGVQFDWRGN